jgi:hypothetical protein
MRALVTKLHHHQRDQSGQLTDGFLRSSVPDLVVAALEAEHHVLQQVLHAAPEVLRIIIVSSEVVGPAAFNRRYRRRWVQGLL